MSDPATAPSRTTEHIPLSLSIQYQTPCPALPRWRIRRWVSTTLRGLSLYCGPRHNAHQVIPNPAGLVLTIRLTDTDEARELNAAYRGRDYPTNVLTFEYGADPDGVYHGDIVLCVPVIEKEAAEQSKPFLHHAAHLCVHGTLHALGYDHDNDQDATIMEALEVAILARMNIGNPYL